ncbi:hypothetical protein LG943_00720 [Streptomonospora sp. S1-112]|uniref:Uncharacterized protein n=1 Tax=Streptomonospora mangrovi TaxID=2883123 RepID=A0A9X3NRP9_9ACTN|nr:hypothetical protein [Streptomonospora mangrovi]MDA0562866.1 hypothetical protein [Streptomonospora mangrovi]
MNPPDIIRAYSVADDFASFDIPTDRMASAVLHALFREDSPLAAGVVAAYLRLPRDRGGYGAIALSEGDVEALRAEVVRQGRVILAAEQ